MVDINMIATVIVASRKLEASIAPHATNPSRAKSRRFPRTNLNRKEFSPTKQWPMKIPFIRKYVSDDAEPISTDTIAKCDGRLGATIVRFKKITRTVT